MAHYHIWTMGCQMNKADSERLASYLEGWGWGAVPNPEEADLVVVNTCVVRQRAEDRALSKLENLGALKKSRPHLAIALTGCLVDSQEGVLKLRFPQVDLFFRPQAFEDFFSWARERGIGEPGSAPPLPSYPCPSTFVPIIQGCDSFCSYCIVPLRRGRERSRPVEEIVCEVQELVRRGVKEVVLLGQNVNAYGHDLPSHPGLADLLTELNRIEGLARIRFLTSHPRSITARFIDTIARLDKVCPHLSLPVQAGDDKILRAMGRGYTVKGYRKLVERLRGTIPGVSLSTDVIVGFPGESKGQFERTLKLLKEIRFDTVHVAAYSPRHGTWASRKLKDAVPSAEKKLRQRRIEELQEAIAEEINARLLGKTVEVLVEGRGKGKWQGRTRTGKLVFFEDGVELKGELVGVRIEKSSPWWLEGRRC